MLLLTYLRKKGHLEFLKDKFQMKTDVLSGLTVALALVPEAVAFAFVAGIDPLIGLYGALIMCFITAAFGGRPGMISGATGALAVVMVALVTNHGVEYLFVTLILMGILQILFGIFRFGKYVRLIPHPVMLGFVNGLAIVIFLAQMGQFKVGGEWLTGTSLFIMLGLALLTMLIVHFLPKYTKSIPSGLAGIGFVTLLVIFIPGLETRTVLDYLKEGGGTGISGGFPTFSLPNVPFSIETLMIILPYSVILASVGLIESLMTLTLIDEKTETRGHSNAESKAQGIGNIICGFFGGMGGCAMIGQSMINISSGGRGRLSGISASLFLLVFIMFGSSIIEVIPLAALVGLMFIVVIGTFAWPTIKIINKIPRADAFVLLAVTIITVFTDLAMAVISGVIISALVFAWQKSHEMYAVREVRKHITYYKLDGPLFFGSVTSFKSIFDIKHDTNEVVIDFMNSKVTDHSALEAIDSLTDRYQKAGKKLHLIHLSKECRVLLENAKQFVDVNISEDPKYFVADIDGDLKTEY